MSLGIRAALTVAAILLGAGGGFAQTVEYYHVDALGSVRAVTNEAGQVIERHDYLPYGEEWCGNQVCGFVAGGQPKRFTGKERDAETGLDYFGARYYSLKFGRFTTIDPVYTWDENLVDPQRWNRYAYARNNPMRFVDPDGRADKTPGESAKEAVGLIMVAAGAWKNPQFVPDGDPTALQTYLDEAFSNVTGEQRAAATILSVGNPKGGVSATDETLSRLPPREGIVNSACKKGGRSRG